jgi:hypothetical protein
LKAAEFFLKRCLGLSRSGQEERRRAEKGAGHRFDDLDHFGRREFKN